MFHLIQKAGRAAYPSYPHKLHSKRLCILPVMMRELRRAFTPGLGNFKILEASSTYETHAQTHVGIQIPLLIRLDRTCVFGAHV